MTNEQVKQAFADQRPGSSANLSTDGISIKSYHWWECGRWVDGVPYIRNGKSYSMTTACKHRQGIVGVKVEIETFPGDALMNLDF